jgi:outer membrane protein insertion porin family/translocation and assembly module TamA
MRHILPGFALAALLVVAAGCREEGAVRVNSITFDGVSAVDADRLKDVLATKASSILPWGRTRFFDRSRFDADLKRIQAFYADRGYPDARVTGFDVQLNDAQDAVDITLTIAEGDAVTVAEMVYVGFDQIPPARFEALKSRVPVKVGAPRDRQLVVAAHEMAVNELKDHGFPYAKVNVAEAEAAPKQATLTFTAVPGRLAHIGEIEIAGNQSVSERVIERQLTFRRGDLYRRTSIQASQRRLYSMELFQFANIEPVDPEAQPEEVPIRVTVAEGRHQRVNFGIGYGTEEKARVDGEYRHLNFLGAARSAGVHGRWSSLDRGIRVDFNQPYFFSPGLAFGATGQQWRTFTPAYQSVITGAKVAVTHRRSPWLSAAVSFTNEHVTSAIANDVLTDLSLRNDLIALGLDPTTGEQNGTLNALGFDLQLTTADNILDATRGYQASFHAEQAGRFLPGDFSYFSMSFDGRHYLPIGGRLVLASRAQIGGIDAPGNDPRLVPFSRKYFLGGAASLRGWGRYEVSPLSGSGLPLGGLSLLAVSEEARFGLSGKLSGVVFLDAGNVWADDWTFDFGELRYAVGPGLRYQTPVGPVRLDVGYQLNPIDGLLVDGEPQARRWRLHVSIGQAY